MQCYSFLQIKKYTFCRRTITKTLSGPRPLYITSKNQRSKLVALRTIYLQLSFVSFHRRLQCLSGSGEGLNKSGTAFLARWLGVGFLRGRSGIFAWKFFSSRISAAKVSRRVQGFLKVGCTYLYSSIAARTLSQAPPLLIVFWRAILLARATGNLPGGFKTAAVKIFRKCTAWGTWQYFC